jgi:transglutaminase-like putative cysteine protease
MRGRFWVGVLAVWWSSGTSIAVADRVLDGPAFAASPSQLLASSRAAPDGDWPAVIVRNEHDVSFDERGCATVRWRLVFVVRTRAGIDSWGTVRSEWRPYYQYKPFVRARVIDPGGDVAELDPALVGDAPVTQPGTFAVSDRRRLEAPLPRLQIGAVVEQEIVTIDREPMLAAGTVDTTPIGGEVPTLSTVIAYSAPAVRKVHHVARRLPSGVRARHQVANGRESWVYRIGLLPPRATEPDAPGDAQPYVGVGTAASWTAVARGYGALLDERIADGPVAWPAEVTRAGARDAVNAIAAWVRTRVRYAAIELGQASNVPWSPAETVRRGFGDCKDMALLMVALLRQAGIRAEVALLAAGPGVDVDPDLPGMGAFDHAIVRARLDGRDVWIDAAEDLMRPGQLPVRDQNRRALVIADDTARLVATPAATPAENTIREVRTFIAADSGRTQVTEVTTATGTLERNARAWFRVARRDEVRGVYADYVDDTYHGALERVTWSAAADLAVPFETTVVVKDATPVSTSPGLLDIRLYPRAALGRLPPTVTERALAVRTQDFAWPIPHVYEIENRIAMPQDFTPPAPFDRACSLGPATLIERRRVDGRTLIVTFRFESGKSRLSPVELAALRDALRRVRDEEVRITVEHAAFTPERASGREAIAIAPADVGPCAD